MPDNVILVNHRKRIKTKKNEKKPQDNEKSGML